MQDRKIYAVWTNEDLTEGRGREYVRYFCELEATARRLAKGGYVQGTDCRVTEETFLFQDGQWYAPGPRTESATVEDIAEEKMATDARLRAQNFDKVWRKAAQAGLTQDDLDVLTRGING